MALFKRQKAQAPEVAKTETGKAKSKAAPAPARAPRSGDARLILRPRITEKATMASEKGVYVFEIAQSATKGKVAGAIHALYKVTPRKVRIVSIAKKRIASKKHRGVFGETGGGKKAYVYLKEGDKIDIV